MAYCHECGSEVAEIDTFCPYCGITLQPIIIENGDDDDSLGSTIVIPSPVKSAPVTDQKNAGADDDKTAVFENSELDFSDDKTGDYSNNLTSENVAAKTETVEIPVEESNAEVPSASDYDYSHQAAPETSFENSKDITDQSEFNIEGENNPGAAADSANAFLNAEPDEIENVEPATESSLMSYDEAEIKEIPSAEEPESEAGEDETKSADSDFSATVPYIPPAQTENVPQKNAATDDVTAVSELFVQPDAVQDSPAPELPVSKPAEELPEAVCPPPRFDSVRIMEIPSEPKISEKPADASAAVKLQQEESLRRAEQSAEDAEKRSYTTPIAGFGDTDGKKRAKLKPLDEGTVLNDRYEIVRKIGGGGMGAVYLASDKNLGGVLRAVKEMVQSYIEGEQQEKAINDFKRESVLLSTLDHPAIPTIYDYFFEEQEGRFYLVMKYISGGDLAARIRSAPEGRLDERSVTEWAIQIADVLDYLHNRQIPIVYRDLKPANIMIDGNSGRVMLIDFGIARFINKEEKGVTAVGTMGYAPPELFSGNVEPRSDIYSLGSTMFHLLTGADPQSNPLLIFDFQKHPRPRQINPQLSDQIEKILMRAVEYNANQRFSSAAELRQGLQEHLKNLNASSVSYGVRETPASAGLSDQLVFCGFCGQKIVATDMFCAFCGAKQPLAQQGVRGETYAPQPMTAQLLIIGTNELETPAYRIEKDENLVGRRDPMSNIFPEVDLSKFDPQTKISRRHARIWRDGNQFMVEDLGSSNGTIVLPVVSDTVRLMPHQPYTLTNGDKLRLGDTMLHFIIG